MGLVIQLPMKTHTTSRFLISGALALVLSLASFAQAGEPSKSGDKPKGDRPEGRGDRPPAGPLMMLDADRDGVLSSAEIDAAPAALRKLDKNGDGQLTPRELRPPGGPGRDGKQGKDGPGDDLPPPSDN